MSMPWTEYDDEEYYEKFGHRKGEPMPDGRYGAGGMGDAYRVMREKEQLKKMAERKRIPLPSHGWTTDPDTVTAEDYQTLESKYNAVGTTSEKRRVMIETLEKENAELKARLDKYKNITLRTLIERVLDQVSVFVDECTMTGPGIKTASGKDPAIHHPLEPHQATAMKKYIEDWKNGLS